MCGGGPSMPKDNSAEIAKQQEAEKQARITNGKAKIDESYAGFNDDFYSSAAESYKSAYMPEIDRQYKAAVDSLTKQLATQGLLTSGEGGRQMGELSRSYEEAKAKYAQNALDYGNSIKTNVAQDRATLISQLEGGGSAENAASQAANMAAARARPGNFSPLGQLFASAGAQAGNAAIGGGSMGTSYAGYGLNTGTDPGLFNATGNKSSNRVVA